MKNNAFDEIQLTPASEAFLFLLKILIKNDMKRRGISNTEDYLAALLEEYSVTLQNS